MDLSNVVFIESNQQKGKQKQNSDKKAWNMVPPAAHEPLTKRRHGKVYHYCKYCQYWGLHQPGKGKNCKQVEPLAELMSAFGNKGAFQGTMVGNSGASTETSQWNVFGSSSTKPNNPPLGAPLTDKKSVFSDGRNSFGWGKPAQAGIFGGGHAVKPSPFAVASPTTEANRQCNSLFGASSMSVSMTNQSGRSPFGAGAKTGLFGSSNPEKPFGSSSCGPATQSLFGFPKPVQKSGRVDPRTSFVGFGATSAPKETRVEAQSLFVSQNHTCSSSNAFGATAAPKVAQAAPQPLFSSSPADSSRIGCSTEPAKTSLFSGFGKFNSENQKSSSFFGSNERSFGFGFGNSSTSAAPNVPATASPVAGQTPSVFPSPPPPASDSGFHFSAPPTFALTPTQPIPAPSPQCVVPPSKPAEVSAASRQSSVPSFLYDHYPSQAPSTTVPTTWVAPCSYYATDVYSLQVAALETKRQEVAQYLAH